MTQLNKQNIEMKEKLQNKNGKLNSENDKMKEIEDKYNQLKEKYNELIEENNELKNNEDFSAFKCEDHKINKRIKYALRELRK